MFAAAVAVPALALVFYKYRELLLASAVLERPVGLAHGGHSGAAQVALPLAISFFTFEFVHYLTDVYHGSPPIRNPFRFVYFSIFFPSIVSGPIKRYQPFLAQVEAGMRRPGVVLALTGAAQVLVGFFKKLVVADNAALAIELVEKRSRVAAGSVALLLLLLSMRILFDFSGYSDIAIGLARMLGIALPENFRYPYIARNISEFWQRWHISLSRWIRDYIYIPLGGGRHGILVKAANLSRHDVRVRPVARRRVAFRLLGAVPRGRPHGARRLGEVALGTPLRGAAREPLDRNRGHRRVRRVRLAPLLLSPGSRGRDVHEGSPRARERVR